jgi:hypothetical protein
MSDENDMGHIDIAKEQAKRERHLNDAQRRAWSDGLLASLPESKAYQAYCTPEARLREQQILLQQLSDWLERQG